MMEDLVSLLQRCADSFAEAAYLADAAEDLIAGVRDSTGVELMPRQAAMFILTGNLITSISCERALGQGDQTLTDKAIGPILIRIPAAITEGGWFKPTVMTWYRDSREASDAFVQRIGAAGSREARDTSRAFLAELALMARAKGRDELGRELERDWDRLVSEAIGSCPA